MSFPIYIPSKGKPVNRTGQLLKGHREYTIFTDPSQVEAYREHHEIVVSIEEDNLASAIPDALSKTTPTGTMYRLAGYSMTILFRSIVFPTGKTFRLRTAGPRY
jgi:hypothetical protein